MIEIIGFILTYVIFVGLIFLEAIGILGVVKLGFIGMEYVDKITDKLKKKVRIEER
ncbi:hypothetical protein [Clostridium sp. UBA7791]|uniref:hypothetical protein n=1 Tax=Clostridium sp. UBA7791 TaxID=1946379 RepID=UPI003216A574